MLTRLKISGFKNLVEVDLSFGPFTCIAGENAVGKSNLFDAIMFLGALADAPLVEAAMAVRDKSSRSSDIRSLFHATSDGHVDRMTFEAEMIVANSGKDDLGQQAVAGTTFLRYSLEIVYRGLESDEVRPSLEITKEELDYISIGKAPRFLPFKPSTKWRQSVIRGRRTSPFISTDQTMNGTNVRLHQEGRSGRTKEFLATALPRTVLSTVNAAESPTAVLARREMQSWRLLQLEPSALRKSDPFTAPTDMGSDGSHLPATLYRLANARNGTTKGGDVYTAVSNRLAELVSEVKAVRVDRDDKRELLTLVVHGADGTVHAARSLSDGTLRFLALAILEADPSARGVLCLEEPENGIHPERIVAMLNLLQDLATDIGEVSDEKNPLRQVVITTHSPTVVAQVPDDSLLFAERAQRTYHGAVSSIIAFRHLSGTWRANDRPSAPSIQKGQILKFLNPVRDDGGEEDESAEHDYRRVVDNPSVADQLKLWPTPTT